MENEEKGVKYILVKPSDVAVYVEHGAADIGIVGYDVIKENEPDVFELLDLDIGKCSMAVAAPKGFEDTGPWSPARGYQISAYCKGILHVHKPAD